MGRINFSVVISLLALSVSSWVAYRNTVYVEHALTLRLDKGTAQMSFGEGEFPGDVPLMLNPAVLINPGNRDSLLESLEVQVVAKDGASVSFDIRPPFAPEIVEPSKIRLVPLGLNRDELLQHASSADAAGLDLRLNVVGIDSEGRSSYKEIVIGHVSYKQVENAQKLSVTWNTVSVDLLK